MTLATAVPAPATAPAPPAGLGVLVGALAGLTAISSLAGVLASGGPGRTVVETARGVEVALHGSGLYAADTVLVGAGNRGQDVAMLLVEVPLLLAVARRYCRGTGGPVAAAALTGVLAFFAYYWTSMVVATAQNRLFPLYVAAFACAGAALVAVARRLDLPAVAAALPSRPGRRVLGGYLVAVAAALVLAWLPGLVLTALRGDAAEAVGPYTSAVTEALDLGVVVPVVATAAVLVLTGRPAGRGMALVILVLNVSIGVLLMAQGTAQLVLDVPLTPGEVVGKMLSFAVLTLVAGGLLVRTATAAGAGGVSRGGGR